MISRRPLWMLLVTCALLSSGSSTMAQAASQGGHGSQGTHSYQGELLLSQATEPEAEESSTEEEKKELDRPTLSLGGSGPLVIQIQVLLQEQGLYGGTINGDFDADTVEAVKEFQTENGLEPTGAVDNSTWGPLTGELAEPEPETSEEAPPSPEPASSETGPSTKMRLLIAAAALVGLGAGGFGLWKMLSVPVPQPLAYPDGEDEEDDYIDDLNGEQTYSSQSVESRQGETNTQEASPIVVPAALAAQPSQMPALTGEMVEEETDEVADFSGLEEIDLPPDEAPAIQASTQPVETIAAPNQTSSIEETIEPNRQGLETAQDEANQKTAALQQAVVKDATGHNLADAKISVAQAQQKQASPTDTAVAIATKTARAAARKKAAVPQAKRTPLAAGSPIARVASTQGKSKSAKSASQRKPGLAKTGSTKIRRNKSNRTLQAPPPPPPAPSEIVRAAPAGAIEQPELVTTPLMGRVDIVETLITDLQGVDPAKRRKAIWELGQRCDSRAIQPLVNMMGNSDSRQRSLILAALSEIGTQTLKPMKQALAISLQDDNAEVRKNAIRDLTRIYDLVAQISHLLNSALDDPDPEVQDTARWALKQLNRIRSNAGLEGTSDQPMLQQSVSPPESFSGEDTLKSRSLPKV